MKTTMFCDTEPHYGLAFYTMNLSGQDVLMTSMLATHM